MPYIKTPLIIDDDAPTAAELNQPYDDLATASAGIDGNNVAAGALRHQHIFTDPSSLYFNEDSNTTNINDISSTVYVTLTRGATPMEISLNKSLKQFQTVRISGCGLVTNNDVNVIWDDQAVPPNGKPNLYAFRILITYNEGAGDITQSLGEWGYSFGTASSTNRDASIMGGIPSSSIALCYQTFQFEGIWRAPSDNTVLTKIELQAKVYDATNVLRISRNALHAIVGEI